MSGLENKFAKMSSTARISSYYRLTMLAIMVLSIIMFVSIPLAKAQDEFEMDEDAIPIQPVQQPNNNRRSYDRFNSWMKVLQEFFTEGNWLNGGPNNLIEYITRTLSKLLEILMNRHGGGGANGLGGIFSLFNGGRGNGARPSNGGGNSGSPSYDEANEPNDIYENTRVTDSNNHNGGMQFGRQKLNLNDLLRMLPADQLNRFNHR